MERVQQIIIRLDILIKKINLSNSLKSISKTIAHWHGYIPYYECNKRNDEGCVAAAQIKIYSWEWSHKVATAGVAIVVVW